MVDQRLLDEMYAKRGYLFEWQVLLAQEAPEFMRAFDATWTQVNTDRPGGLAAQKYRELVYSPQSASLLGEDTVAKNHMHKALDAGATRTELIDAILVAWTPSGSRTLIHGLRAVVDVSAGTGRVRPARRGIPHLGPARARRIAPTWRTNGEPESQRRIRCSERQAIPRSRVDRRALSLSTSRRCSTSMTIIRRRPGRFFDEKGHELFHIVALAVLGLESRTTSRI